jgi:hypothetical protein
MLCRLSTRLFPRRSGTSRVRGSATSTKPGASPRGEQSSPSGPLVASAKNGAAATIAAYSAVRWSVSLRRLVASGSP